MPQLVRQPLSWYVEKLRNREDFTTLLFGDGEFTVAVGQRMGERYTHYREAVTSRMQTELLEALDDGSPDIIYGTDLNLVEYMEYRGNDADTFREVGQRVAPAIARNPNIVWHDGVVWDAAVQSGDLRPLLSVLHERDVVLVGNHRLQSLQFLHPKLFVTIPPKNAYRDTDSIEAKVMEYGKPAIYIVCAGLGAIPLIMRLRRQIPNATFLDLGSTFDVFVGLGAERGWRAELYANHLRLAQVVHKNTKDVCRCRKVRP